MDKVTPNVPLVPGPQMFAMRVLVFVIFVVFGFLGMPAAASWLHAQGWTQTAEQDIAASVGLLVVGATACRWLFYRLYRNAERAFDAALSDDEAAERRRDRYVRRYYWIGGFFFRAHRVRSMSPAEFEVRAQRHEVEIWLGGLGTAAVLTIAFLRPDAAFLVRAFFVAALITFVGSVWTWWWPVRLQDS
jgi:hypothetical protein